MSENLLKGKKILLGVTGSIAIYKSLELVRLFVKAGASVRVLMSEDAKRFVTALSFEALSANTVLSEDTESWTDDNNHIHIGKWADMMIIAPASANTINKMAAGIADNLLTQTILAFNKKILVAPSANTNMITHQITTKSIDTLKDLGIIISEPQDKLLACNDKGVGAMSAPESIFEISAQTLLQDSFYLDKKVLISGGGSVEKIDDVRCITNFSSGKMAEALAYAFYLKGADVTLVSSVHLSQQALHVNRIHVSSSKDFLTSLQEHAQKSDYLLMAAAISDYIPQNCSSGKLKKSDIGTQWNLPLIQNSDILSKIQGKNLKKIGFKAELDTKAASKNATKMLHEKNLHAVCLNILENAKSFGTEESSIEFISNEGSEHLAQASKLELALQISELCKQL